MESVDRQPEVDAIPRLTTAASAGEHAAFRELFDRYYSRIYRYAWTVTQGNGALSHDVAQEVMLRFHRNIKVFSSEEHLWFWLARVARFVLIDLDRAAGRRQQLNTKSVDSSDHESSIEAENRLLQAIRASVDKLPAVDQALVEDFYFSRRSVQHIADRQRTTYKSIESRLQRIRNKLREMCLKKIQNEER